MRLAIIGRDRYVDQLVQIAQESDEFQLVAFYPDSPGDHLPGVIARDGWESLSADADVDGVIIASSSDQTLDRRAEQLRTLIRSDLSLLVVHPGCEAIVAFEIEMQAEPEKIRIVTYQPWRDHAVWGLVADKIRHYEATAGNIQIMFERRLNSFGASTTRAALAQDACIARQLIGPIRRVSALASDDSDVAAGAVRMIGGTSEENRGKLSVQWSPLTLPPLCDLRVQITSDDGNASLQWILGTQPEWRVDQEFVEVPPAAPLAKPLHDLRDAAVGLSDWVEAARGTEIAEAAERSRKRGRAVELYEESHSEQDTFKGVMAASGCLLLLFILLGFVVGAIVEGVRFPYARKAHQERLEAARQTGEPAPDMRSPLWIRLIPAYPVVIFLMLQSLWLVAKRGDKGETSDSQPNAP